eukprot:scaffold47663_cov270-Isochrysis_galbana.AAC.2
MGYVPHGSRLTKANRESARRGWRLQPAVALRQLRCAVRPRSHDGQASNIAQLHDRRTGARRRLLKREN